MKLCFMFINREDCKKVGQFLSKYINIKRNIYLGYDVLLATESEYEQAITKGIDFIVSNNINSAWWIDKYGKKTSLDCIPLLFAEIPNYFKRNNFWKTITKKLCNVYAKKIQKRLGEPVILHYTPCYNVEFRLVRNNENLANHEQYMEEMTKYCLAHYHIFNYISVCDAYGKSITLINQNHSVEWPTKRPQ